MILGGLLSLLTETRERGQLLQRLLWGSQINELSQLQSFPHHFSAISGNKSVTTAPCCQPRTAEIRCRICPEAACFPYWHELACSWEAINWLLQMPCTNIRISLLTPFIFVYVFKPFHCSRLRGKGVIPDHTVRCY